ncbi:MAG: glycosyltransferase family 4 protein [Planctomycetales bacterium]|nr:glycosyltransferase family 4 protein [Planctomycetales bacterium]
MKTLYICADIGIPVLGGKGGAVHVRSMVKALEQLGHQVVLTAPMLTKSPWEIPVEPAGQLLHIPPHDGVKETALVIKEYVSGVDAGDTALSGQVRRLLYNQQLIKRLIRKFDSHPPDFIYERCSLFSTAGVALAKAIDRPLVVELNAPLANEQAVYRGSSLDALARHAEHWTLQHADVVVTVSHQVRNYAISVGVDAERVHVVPNGVDIELFHPERNGWDAKQHWGLRNGPTLGFVGGLKPWHGVESLPKLLADLLPEFPSLQLVIVGEGPYRKELVRQLQAYGVEDHAVLTGHVTHVQIPHLVRQFDIALAPYPNLSHEFYFSPLKLFEYMACGVPVVAPSLGQIEAVVRHEENGLLYPAEDHQQLSAACRRLLARPDLRQKLGSQAAAEVRNEYTWKRNAERVVQLVRGVARSSDAQVQEAATLERVLR